MYFSEYSYKLGKTLYLREIFKGKLLMIGLIGSIILIDCFLENKDLIRSDD